MAHKRFLAKYDDQKIFWLRFVKTLLLFAVILFVVFKLVIGISSVSGSSMYPTLHDGQPVVFLRFIDDYDRGDIISAKMPSGEYYVKRVVAVAGDTVDIRDGKVYINDVEETGDYINGATDIQEDLDYPMTLKEGQIFVLGDNREVSIDSRTYGPFAVSQTRGKVLK